ncbi:hypothetical protein C8J56DRAFT_888959 [Mycena floridula]|nr:hypothetical protein C8J56DRAFT_888959 [Mycena floridula]
MQEFSVVGHPEPVGPEDLDFDMFMGRVSRNSYPDGSYDPENFNTGDWALLRHKYSHHITALSQMAQSALVPHQVDTSDENDHQMESEQVPSQIEHTEQLDLSAPNLESPQSSPHYSPHSSVEPLERALSWDDIVAAAYERYLSLDENYLINIPTRNSAENQYDDSQPLLPIDATQNVRNGKGSEHSYEQLELSQKVPNTSMKSGVSDMNLEVKKKPQDKDKDNVIEDHSKILVLSAWIKDDMDIDEPAIYQSLNSPSQHHYQVTPIPDLQPQQHDAVMGDDTGQQGEQGLVFAAVMTPRSPNPPHLLRFSESADSGPSTRKICAAPRKRGQGQRNKHSEPVTSNRITRSKDADTASLVQPGSLSKPTTSGKRSSGAELVSVSNSSDDDFYSDSSSQSSANHYHTSSDSEEQVPLAHLHLHDPPAQGWNQLHQYFTLDSQKTYLEMHREFEAGGADFSHCTSTPAVNKLARFISYCGKYLTFTIFQILGSYIRVDLFHWDILYVPPRNQASLKSSPEGTANLHDYRFRLILGPEPLAAFDNMHNETMNRDAQKVVDHMQHYSLLLGDYDNGWGTPMKEREYQADLDEFNKEASVDLGPVLYQEELPQGEEGNNYEPMEGPIASIYISEQLSNEEMVTVKKRRTNWQAQHIGTNIPHLRFFRMLGTNFLWSPHYPQQEKLRQLRAYVHDMLDSLVRAIIKPKYRDILDHMPENHPLKHYF